MYFSFQSRMVAKSLLCLLATTCLLANALKIRNGNRCLNWEGTAFPFNPIKNSITNYYFCELGERSTLNEAYWEKLIVLDGGESLPSIIQLCIQKTNLCLGLQRIVTTTSLYIVAIISEKDPNNLSQQWLYNGRKLTNLKYTPAFCAQFERDNLRMYPCDANEPKQIIEIDNKIFPLDLPKPI